MDISAEEKSNLLDRIGKPKTYEEILNEKIKHFVLLHEADRKGLKADFEECKKEAVKVYASFSQVEEDDFENYQTFLIIKDYKDRNNLSDDEYTEILANKYYDSARINMLQDYFEKNLYDVQSSLSCERQYSEYTQKLINNAKIRYYG